MTARSNTSFVIALAGWVIPILLVLLVVLPPVGLGLLILGGIVAYREYRIHQTEKQRIAREQAAWGGFYRLQ